MVRAVNIVIANCTHMCHGEIGGNCMIPIVCHDIIISTIKAIIIIIVVVVVVAIIMTTNTTTTTAIVPIHI
jgi:uncharacterized membrane protein